MEQLTLCRACGDELGFKPWRGESASHEICPSCGIHFGCHDVPEGGGLVGNPSGDLSAPALSVDRRRHAVVVRQGGQLLRGGIPDGSSNAPGLCQVAPMGGQPGLDRRDQRGALMAFSVLRGQDKVEGEVRYYVAEGRFDFEGEVRGVTSVVMHYGTLQLEIDGDGRALFVWGYSPRSGSIRPCGSGKLRTEQPSSAGRLKKYSPVTDQDAAQRRPSER